MKKITLTLVALLLTVTLWQVNAQTCDYVEAGIHNGTDQDGAATPIDMSCVPAGNFVNNVVVNDFTSHYFNPTGTTTWCTDPSGAWYHWDIVVNGSVEATDVCGVDIEAFDYSVFFPITSIAFVIEDADGFNDNVYMDIDATIHYAATVGEPPVISCPTDAVADSEPGECGAVVNFADASAIDAEDGPIATYQSDTTGFASGDVFPIGVTIIEFSAEDSDGNTSTCSFTVTVTDVENPVAMCQDFTVELDGAGMASIVPGDIDNGSSDNCGFVLSLDNSSFSCADVGENTVTLTITDDSMLTATCTATVTVEDNQAPAILCMGIEGGTFAVMEDFEAASIPADWTTVIESGSWDWTFGSGTMPVGDSFPTNAAIFDDDAAGGTGENHHARLLSPVYNLAGFLSGSMSFDYTLQDFAGYGKLTVEVWDGSAWVEVLLADDADIPPTNSGVMDVTPYANANFQVRFSYDDENTGWNWGAGVDNFVFDYEIATTPPLELVLGADGTVVVDKADMVFSVDDNCGYSVGGTTFAEISNPRDEESGLGTVETFLVANDFEILANEDFTMTQLELDFYLDGPGPLSTVDVYFFEDNAGTPGAQIGSEMAITPTSVTYFTTNTNGQDGYEAVIDITPFVFASQATPTTYWVGILADANGTWTGLGATQTSTIGSGLYYSSDGGASFTNAGVETFDGVYTYHGSYGSAEITLDCSNLGENMIDVTVTDAGGNEATCTATVIVTDETAPVLVCGPEPLLYGADMASDSPGLVFGASPSVITSVLTVADDFTLTDLNVDMNISHNWISDIYMTLTSPAGTEVVLWNNSGGYGIDIVMTFDDEGTPADEALSTFDGENLMGDWTLTVEDTFTPLDDGVLNSWGIAYEYSYPNPSPDLFIELGPDGTVTIEPMDVLSTLEEACAIDVMLLDITEFSCADIGTPTLVTVFANDTSGNFASCQVEVNIVDNMEPTLTCPADTTAPFDPATGTYVLPDYFGIGDAFATDNCTDASMLVLTQDPAPGTLLGVNPGPAYVITFTAEDENGNIATCTMNLDVDTVGVNDNLLENALSMYPNPATDIVKLVNNSNITLEAAMVYDLNGKLVAEFDLEDMQTETTLDISNFASGVFMVKIIGDDASTVKRLIKE